MIWLSKPKKFNIDFIIAMVLAHLVLLLGFTCSVRILGSSIYINVKSIETEHLYELIEQLFNYQWCLITTLIMLYYCLANLSGL